MHGSPQRSFHSPHYSQLVLPPCCSPSSLDQKFQLLKIRVKIGGGGWERPTKAGPAVDRTALFSEQHPHPGLDSSGGPASSAFIGDARQLFLSGRYCAANHALSSAVEEKPLAKSLADSWMPHAP